MDRWMDNGWGGLRMQPAMSVHKGRCNSSHCSQWDTPKETQDEKTQDTGH